MDDAVLEYLDRLIALNSQNAASTRSKTKRAAFNDRVGLLKCVYVDVRRIFKTGKPWGEE